MEFTYYDDDGWSKSTRNVFCVDKISVKAGDRKQIHFHKTGFYQVVLGKLNAKW